MSRNKTSGQPADFDRARDELFHYIHRCGVIRATPEDQTSWFDDTIEYMAEGYPSLSREQLGELRTIGMRFCRPVIDNVQVDPATEAEREEGSDGASAAAA
ncbi:MAG: hypothetical protein KY464_04925 [Gemmatimonadetes bacterium]|nr:hypothetical protein [Gemmatimonadota bacterium]